jgi:hypothetical protein
MGQRERIAPRSDTPRRRGRPPKYGRPARLVAVTLPHDVVDWLASLDPDLGRAIVRLHDRMNEGPARSGHDDRLGARLVDVGEGRALIIVDPALVHGLAGVAAIPFGSGQAFLALESSWTMADLELTVVDALDHAGADERRRTALAAFRDQLRAWRTHPSLLIEPRAIIVASRNPKRKSRS